MNTTTATAFHNQVQAALPTGYRADTWGSGLPMLGATVYDASGQQAACHYGTPAEILSELAVQHVKLLAQMEAQRASLAYLNHAGSL